MFQVHLAPAPCNCGKFPAVCVWSLCLILLGAAFAQTPRRAASSPVKTPAQIIAEYGPAVALIVSADVEPISLGSGFFVDDGSLLVTNFHVVEGANEIFVKLQDGRILRSKKIAAFDVEKDLVVVKLDTPSSRRMVLGDSDQVKTGDPIVVVGNPEGLEQTVSNGLISGMRTVDSEKRFQISAPISLGSSGGPVFDEHGAVIGVAFASYREGQNLNFAIPINLLRPLLSRQRIVSVDDLPRRPGSAGTQSLEHPLEGSWTATFADSLGSGQMVLSFAVLEGEEVVGTYTSTQGGGGGITGKITGGRLQFDLTQSNRDCPGSYSGSAPVRQAAIVGTYTGYDCQGYHTNGTFSMVRSTGSLIPATPLAPSRNGDVKPVVQHGAESELLSAKAVYVYCKDFEVRANIVKELRKYGSLTVTDDLAAADTVLIFGADQFSMGDYTYIWQDYAGNVYGSSTPRYGITGYGLAVKFAPPNFVRVVWSFRDTRTTLYERRPSTNFARNFIKVLKRLRKQ